MVGVNLESVYCYVWIDSNHVFVRPSKAVIALLEELDEYEVEFRAESCTNLNLVVWEVRVYTNIIELVNPWLIGIRVLNRGRL